MRKMKSKYYEEAGAIRIENTQAWRSFLNCLATKNGSYPNIILKSRMFAENKELFKKKWGEQSFCWTGWNRYWIWAHELPSGVLFVLTGETGSSYEIASNNIEATANEAICFIEREIIN